MLQHKPRHLGPGALRVGKIGRVKHHFARNHDGAGKMGNQSGISNAIELGRNGPKIKKKVFPHLGTKSAKLGTKILFENRC